MKRKIISILTVLLAVLMLASTVSAGGNIGLNGISFRSGSLISMGTFTGLGGYSEGVTVELTARGRPVVTCTNQGGNQAPGQNPSNVSGNGDQAIGPQLITKKGTAPMVVTAETGPITAVQGGCPNDNWKATIDFVYWTFARITVTDNVTGDVLLVRDYLLETIRNPDNTATISWTLVQ